MEEVNSAVVVGGGDNGLMAALTLREQHPDVDITVVDDPDRENSDVGKSTTNSFNDIVHDFLEVDNDRFVEEVRPIWKAGIYFEDWCGREPFHLPFDEVTLQPPAPSRDRFDMLYARHRDNGFRSLCVELAERGLTPFMRERGGIQIYGYVAYHLNTRRFNAFLRELCAERDVEIVGDEIATVEVEDGWITRIESDTTEYEADLYVDASGFDRVLAGRLENEFVEFDYPLDSAVVTTVDLSLSEVEPATVIRSGDYGWFWQIDTYDCRDVGYVYASDFLTDADATAEFIEMHDGAFTEDDVTQYRFQSGVLERAWEANCVAVGNALGFVEPLLSVALSTNAQLCSTLSTLLAGHGGINHSGLRELYNDIAGALWDDVYDITSLTYRHSSGDTEFWTAMEDVGDPEGVVGYVDLYHANGFSSYDREQHEPYAYPRYLIYRLLRGLGVRSEFYEDLDIDGSPKAEESIANHEEFLAEQVGNHLSYDDFYAGEYARLDGS